MRHVTSVGVIGTIAAVWLVAVSSGQVFGQKLLSSEPAIRDVFGSAVAIDPLSGAAAVVGASADATDRPGAARIFAVDGLGAWREVATLRPDDSAPGDGFGRSVSAAGTLLGLFTLVGKRGGAYLFVADASTGAATQLARLLPAGDPGLFGFAVGLEPRLGTGDPNEVRPFAIVGDPIAVVQGVFSAGTAVLFGRDPVSGGIVEVARLTPDVPRLAGFFGISVALSGDVAIVGARGEEAAYVFERNHGGPNRWGQVARLVATDEPRGENFGHSPRLPGAGRPPASRGFGHSVALAQDIALVGAPLDNGNGREAGAAYVFQRDGGGPDAWGQVAELTAGGDGAAGSQFGAAVAVSDGLALVGAPLQAVIGGVVYLFGRHQGGADRWGRIAVIDSNDTFQARRFGAAVSLSTRFGPVGLAGAPADDSGGALAGAAYVLSRLAGLGALPAARDSFLRAHAPDRNEGANPRVRLTQSGSNRTVVGFDPDEIDAFIGPNPDALRRAELVLTVAETRGHWRPDLDTGLPLVAAFPLLEGFTEGTGKSAGVRGRERTRGTGPGVTWHCATDTNVANTRQDCADPWDGGTAGPLTGTVVGHVDGIRGELKWNVTADVRAGATGWLVRTLREASGGEVWYFSREGAAAIGNPDLAPRLLLEVRPGLAAEVE